jgi:signal transduction histidine kinase/HAMP domain-containing protein
VLLTVALLVIAQPFFVYFSTNQVVSQLAKVAAELTEIETTSARLLRQVNAIAIQGRNIQFLENTKELKQETASLAVKIDEMISELSPSDQTSERSAKLLKLQADLMAYKSLALEVTDATILRIDTAKKLRTQVAAVRNSISEKFGLLGSVVADRQIELDRHIKVLEVDANQTNIAAVRQAFGALITLNTITDAVDAERFFLSAIERDFGLQDPIQLQARLRQQSRGLVVQIAKLPDGETKTALARLTIGMTNDMFNPDGVFDQIASHQDAIVKVEAGIKEQQTLETQLQEDSRSLSEETQQAFIAASKNANASIASTRLYTNMVAALVGLLIIGLILFVVERQFSSRIRKLTGRVLAIADGKPDTGAPDEFNDELGAMGDALEVFKRNASQLRDANETLAHRNVEVQQLGTRLETVLDTASSGIIAFDNEGQIILANRPARHFLGGASEATPFRRPAEVTFLDREDLSSLDASSDPINRVIAGQILHQEIALMKRAGRGDGRYVRLTSNRVEDAKSMVRMVLAIDDVSDAEQNRQQIERTARLDALGQLTGGIAHDFNNLLATIQYAIQLSVDGIDAEKREKYNKIALESVERGAQLSSRLLSFAKRQPGISKSHKIEKILADFDGLITPTIEAAISINIRIDDPGMSVYCDRAQLENALLNLVLNARDAILREGKGNEITVAVRSVAELRSSDSERDTDPNRYPTNVLEAELRAQEDGSLDHSYRYIEFSVTDNGPGMSDEVKQRALDPFFTTKSTNSGTGLGLSMVYGFVQQSGGEMRVYSEQGHGTTMRLLLPRGSEDNVREEPILRDIPVVGKGQRILLVEDEPHLREAMNDLIIGLGYRVDIAISGKLALETIESGKEFDLLLTELVMPGGISGFELAAKAREIHPDLPILYMSGYAAYTDREMGVVTAPLLQKPCSPRGLADRLQEALA